MKKWVSLILLFCLVLSSLIGCSKPPKIENKSSEPLPKAQSETSSEQPQKAEYTSPQYFKFENLDWGITPDDMMKAVNLKISDFKVGTMNETKEKIDCYVTKNFKIKQFDIVSDVGFYFGESGLMSIKVQSTNKDSIEKIRNYFKENYSDFGLNDSEESKDGASWESYRLSGKLCEYSSWEKLKEIIKKQIEDANKDLKVKPDIDEDVKSAGNQPLVFANVFTSDDKQKDYLGTIMINASYAAMANAAS